METVEERESELAATRAAMEALDGRIAEATAARDAATGAIDQERQHVAANRATIAAKVPAELLALYEKQRERYGVGASHLQGGVTSASGVKLNANDMSAVRAASPDDVILCPDSNAILVRTAESGL
jgi:predicted  nucleic acid-binding Zn-ribbon protein